MDKVYFFFKDYLLSAKLFYFFIVFGFAFSILFIVFKTIEFKRQASSPQHIQKYKSTVQNFFSSILIILIFPFLFIGYLAFIHLLTQALNGAAGTGKTLIDIV